MKLTGIIIAGGKSLRMGQDKGLMIYQQQPLVSYPLKILKELCTEVVISANNKAYEKFGSKVINDEFDNIGPIGGLYSTLKTIKDEWCIVLACDMPFVTKSFLESIIAGIDNRFNAIVPQNNNLQYEPLCAAYSKSCIADIEQSIEQKKYSLNRLLNKLAVKPIIVSDCDNNFTNLNTRDDFDNAQKNI